MNKNKNNHHHHPFPETCDYPGGLQNGFILLVGVKGKFHYRPYVRKIGQNEMVLGRLAIFFYLRISVEYSLNK